MIIHLIQINASYYKVLPKDNAVYDIIWDILSYTKPTRLMYLGGKFTYVKKSEFNKRSGSFGTGLLPFVKSKLEKQNIEYVIKPLNYDKLPMRETVSFNKIKFEDYQQRILNEVSYKTSPGQIEGQTGAGKTLIMAGIIKKYYIPNTLLIVPTSDIARTTRKTLSNLLNRDIGLIGDKEKSIDTVTIGLYQSLSRIPNIKPLVNNTKLIIVDESDVATEAINNIVSQFTNTYYRYGLSATTIPISKKTIWIPGVSQIGQTFISVKDKEVEKRVTDVDAYMIKYTTIVKAKKDYQEVYRYNVLLSNTRTEKILQILQWIFEDQKRINCFIMVDELKQARLLETKIKEKYKSVLVAHGTLEKEKQEKIKEELNNGKLKICIATPVFSRGTNIPGIDSIIMASARKSLSNTKQKIGRGRRKIEGKEKLLLVDIYDEVKGYEKYFEKYSKMRMNLYKRQGWWRGFI